MTRERPAPLPPARAALAAAVGALVGAISPWILRVEDHAHGGPALHQLSHVAVMGALVALLAGIVLGHASRARILALAAVAAVGWLVAALAALWLTA